MYLLKRAAGVLSRRNTPLDREIADAPETPAGAERRREEDPPPAEVPPPRRA